MATWDMQQQQQQQQQRVGTASSSTSRGRVTLPPVASKSLSTSQSSPGLVGTAPAEEVVEFSAADAKEIFEAIDADADGLISRKEMLVALTKSEEILAKIERMPAPGPPSTIYEEEDV